MGSFLLSLPPRRPLPRHLPHDGLMSIPIEGEVTMEMGDEPGTFDFRCDVHPIQMTGTLIAG